MRTYKDTTKVMVDARATHDKPAVKFDVGSAHVNILYPPPIGHLGCYAVIDDPKVLPEDQIIFTRFANEVLMWGVVTYVELPGSSVRPDMKEFENWYKIHWVPTDETAIKNFRRKSSVRDCPKCGVDCKVYQSREVEGKIIRLRRCAKCGKKWSSIETFTGQI